MPLPDSLVRLRQMFPDIQTQNPPSSADSGIESQNQIDPLIKAIFEQYKPETKATDAYVNLLNQYPQREPPGKLRNVLATMASFGEGAGPAGMWNGSPVGFKSTGAQPALVAGDLIRYRPFYEQLEDWQSKLKPTEAAALNERYYNQNMRQSVNDLASRAMMAQRNDITQQKNIDWARNEEDKRMIDWYEAETGRLKQQDAGMKEEVDQQGNVFLRGSDGKTIPVRKPDGRPFTSFELTKVQEARQRAIIQAQASMGNTFARNAGVDKAGNIWSINPATGELQYVPPATGTPAKPPTVPVTTAPGQAAPGTVPQGVPPQTSGTAAPTVPGAAPPRPTAPVGGIVGKFGAKSVQPQNLEAIRESARETLGALNELLDENGKTRPEINKYVGLGRAKGALERYLPGAEARTTQSKIDRVKNLLTVNLIAEMKNQSRTGATGFGQLSGRELSVLEAAASRLDPGIEKASFNAELNRIKQKLRLILLNEGNMPTAEQLILEETQPRKK